MKEKKEEIPVEQELAVQETAEQDMDKRFAAHLAKRLREAWNPKAWIIFIVWTFLITLIVETLARYHANGVLTGGVFGGVVACFKQPLIVLYSWLVIMFTMSFALLFKRRYFAMSVLSVMWLGFGIADFILLSYRVTPFTAIEFKLLDAAIGVLTNYVSRRLAVVVFILIGVAIAALVLIYIKTPVVKNLKRWVSAILILVHGGVLWIVTLLFLATGVLSLNFPNLANAFLDYGFPYCFANSLFNVGISKPSGYSSEKVQEIVKGTSEPKATEKPAASEEPGVTATPMPTPTPTPEPNMTGPNVIFLQLESFFDLRTVEGLQLSEDATPYFRKMMKDYSSGYLAVPCIGAGTANTEFEVMTGMNLDFFGPGEYPYKTILETMTFESTAYNLKENGYATHAIHNNKANFYNRHLIFPKLGYDDFTSIELMNAPVYTENGWAKDSYLTRYILQSMQATENRDYIYAISVQGHGKYPKEALLANPLIHVEGGVDEERLYGIEYYANQIYEMDTFLRELIYELSRCGEEVVLVAYGDHLPGLGFTHEEMASGDMHNTQYFIWDNIGLEKVDEDLEAYQLASRVLERIGISTGVINSFHQTSKDLTEEEFLANLKILGYDMLYGEQEAYGDREAYQETDMKYGVTHVKLTEAYQDEMDPDYLIVKGEHFTQYTRILMKEERLDAEFVDEQTMRVTLPDYQDGDIISIYAEQNYRSQLVLQTSEPISVMLMKEDEPFDENGEGFEDNISNFGDFDEE